MTMIYDNMDWSFLTVSFIGTIMIVIIYTSIKRIGIQRNITFYNGASIIWATLFPCILSR